MRRLTHVLLGVALLAPVAPAAVAGSAVCRIKPAKGSAAAAGDPSGDATAPERDIRCAAVAVGARTTVVLLVVSDARQRDPLALAAGESWQVEQTRDGVRVVAQREVTAGPDPHEIWALSVGGVRVPFTHATSATTLTWTVKTADLKAPAGGKVAGLRAQTFVGGVPDDSAP
jgi:hypothetical protein